jgi:hypothetical protein
VAAPPPRIPQRPGAGAGAAARPSGEDAIQKSKREKDELEKATGRIEEELEELKAKYDQYFLGNERREPARQRDELKKRVLKLKEAFTRNTGLKFRIQSLHARYLSYERLWMRSAREKEEGTYRRDLFKARLHAAQRGEPPLAPGAAQDATDEAGPAAGAARDGSDETGPAPVAPPPAPAVPSAAPVKPAAPPLPVAAIPGSTPAPRPAAGPSTPPIPPPRPGVPAATAGRPAAPIATPAPRPAAATPPPAAPARPAPPATRVPPAGFGAPPPAAGGMDATQMRALYDSYIAAKRSCNEDTSRLTFEAVSRSVTKQIPELMTRFKAKSVDFKVEVKDGKAVLKAIPKV